MAFPQAAIVTKISPFGSFEALYCVAPARKASLRRAVTNSKLAQPGERPAPRDSVALKRIPVDLWTHLALRVAVHRRSRCPRRLRVFAGHRGSGFGAHAVGACPNSKPARVRIISETPSMRAITGSPDQVNHRDQQCPKPHLGCGALSMDDVAQVNVCRGSISRRQPEGRESPFLGVVLTPSYAVERRHAGELYGTPTQTEDGAFIQPILPSKSGGRHVSMGGVR